MIALDFQQHIGAFNSLGQIGFEDVTDRANFNWMAILYLVCAVIVAAKQYYMTAINCQFTVRMGGHNAETYANNMCWIDGLYPYNLKDFPHTESQWRAIHHLKSNSYAWVGLVLGLQALIYYAVHLVWLSLTERSGKRGRVTKDLNEIVKLASSAAKSPPGSAPHRKCLEQVVLSLDAMLFSQTNSSSNENGGKRERRIREGVSRTLAWLSAQRVLLLYVAYKCVFVGVGVLQLWLMFAFLGLRHYTHALGSHTNPLTWGFDLMRVLAAGQTWRRTLLFPRIGVCRPRLLHVTDANKVFAQCALPINMLHEKLYIALFLATLLVACLTALSIPVWLYRVFSVSRSRHFLRRFFDVWPDFSSDKDGDDKRLAFETFLGGFVRRPDATLILRMIAANCGDLVTASLVRELYAVFAQRRRRHAELLREQRERREQQEQRLHQRQQEQPLVVYPSAPTPDHSGESTNNNNMCTAKSVPPHFTSSPSLAAQQHAEFKNEHCMSEYFRI